MTPDELPPPMECDGVHHEWSYPPQAEGEPFRAVCRYCGVRAVVIKGAWVLEADIGDG
ncbi:hypothetical protein ACFSGX_15170 [Sphingomonas arantia]|uniref:Uncharacterized protein n=1 Tax=Sphingomonas arantia TaxID=1460676 RepID=A0ABW4U1D4_9SPHN